MTSSSSVAPTVSLSPQVSSVSSSASIVSAELPSPQASYLVSAAATSIPSPRASPAASTAATSTAATVSQSLRASSALPGPKVSENVEVKGIPRCAPPKPVSKSEAESTLCAREEKPGRAPSTLEGKSANAPSISKVKDLGKCTVAPCSPATVPLSAVETVVISGAKGEAACTNGSYLFEGKRNGRPFFTKSGLYMYYASSGVWVVSEIDDFKDTKAAGWCHSSRGKYGHPADAKPWTAAGCGEPRIPIKVLREK